MAALDLIQFEPFYKFFPELNTAQTKAVVLMAIGLPTKEMALLLGYPASKHLEAARLQLELPTIGMLRSTVQMRVMLGLVGSTLLQTIEKKENREKSKPLWESLTRTEAIVLYYLLRGLSRDELLAKLDMALNTYYAHTLNIKKKFNVTSLGALLISCRDNGCYEALQYRIRSAGGLV